jgi:hypothetical protein
MIGPFRIPMTLWQLELAAAPLFRLSPNRQLRTIGLWPIEFDAGRRVEEILRRR